MKALLNILVGFSVICLLLLIGQIPFLILPDPYLENVHYIGVSIYGLTIIFLGFVVGGLTAMFLHTVGKWIMDDIL